MGTSENFGPDQSPGADLINAYIDDDNEFMIRFNGEQMLKGLGENYNAYQNADLGEATWRDGKNYALDKGIHLSAHPLASVKFANMTDDMVESHHYLKHILGPAARNLCNMFNNPNEAYATNYRHFENLLKPQAQQQEPAGPGVVDSTTDWQAFHDELWMTPLTATDYQYLQQWYRLYFLARC